MNVQDRTHNTRDLLETAYEDYAPDLYRYAVMILADPGKAEDVIQQVFMKTLKATPQLRRLPSLYLYLRTAVRNECFSLLSRQKRSLESIQDPSSRPLLEKVDKGTPEIEDNGKIEAAIRSLPPDQREVIHLKIYEAKTLQEIARLLDMNPNTIASRYRYALDKLREKLLPGIQEK